MNLTTDFLTSPAQTAAYLRTLPAIRERCGRVFELAKAGKLQYFDYHPEKEADVASFCADIIKVRRRHLSLSPPSISPHFLVVC
jgi:hypothetical protein